MCSSILECDTGGATSTQNVCTHTDVTRTRNMRNAGHGILRVHHLPRADDATGMKADTSVARASRETISAPLDAYDDAGTARRFLSERRMCPTSWRPRFVPQPSTISLSTISEGTLPLRTTCLFREATRPVSWTLSTTFRRYTQQCRTQAVTLSERNRCSTAIWLDDL